MGREAVAIRVLPETEAWQVILRILCPPSTPRGSFKTAKSVVIAIQYTFLYADDWMLQDDSGLMQKILIHQSIEFGSDVDNIEDEESNESPDSRLLDSTDEPEPGVRELENDGMGTNEDSNLRRNQHRSIFGAPHRAPMFPKLPISSRSIGNFDRDDTLPLSTGDRSGSSRTSGFRQRTPTPGIDIEYNNPNSSGKFIFEPPPLSISYGWMAKGTNEHVEDLHLSGVLFCDEEVQSEKEIEVLCEYTWIEATPGRAEAGNTLSTIYVPGKCCKYDQFTPL